MLSDVEYRDYMFKLTSGFTVFMGLLGYLAETAYREFFESIIKLAQSEEYSYVIVLFSVIFAVFYLSIRRIGFSYGIRPSKIVFTVALLVLSIAIYSLANVDLEHRIQLIGLSFACVFIALLLLVYELNTLSEVVVLLTPLLLIPIPARVIDTLTPILSKYIGKIAGFVTGANIIETQGSTQLEVISASGELVRLSVDVACTSIMVLSSLLVIIPLLVYIIAFSVDKPGRKALISLISLLIALLIGLTGSFVRTLLLLYVTMKLSAEQAYTLLYYSPPLIYSALSVLVMFYFTRRRLKFNTHWLRSLHRDLVLRATWEYIAGALLLVVVITGIMGITLHVINADLRVPSITVNTTSVLDYLQNPAGYLSTSKVELTNSTSDLLSTRVLGALRVYKVTVRSTGEIYTGYIEVVDTPARLHTWELYLTLQGYFVNASWSSDIGDIRVNYISIKRGNWRGVLAYTIIPVTIKTPTGEHILYTRISLVGEELSNVTNKLGSTILSIIQEHAGQVATSRNIINLVSVLSQSSTFILSGLFVYFIVVLIYKYKKYKSRSELYV